MFDVIITGASFAGLAVASRLPEKRVLVLDRLPIGEGQTSACAIPKRWVTRFGLEDAILQEHTQVYLHLGQKVYVRDISWKPYVSIDYPKFCLGLAQKGSFQFAQERVVGASGQSVYTSQGIHRGKELVDASGWRRVLGEAQTSRTKPRPPRGFGMEVEVKLVVEGLHFYFDPNQIPGGFGWLFGAGSRARAGVVSYQGKTKILPILYNFLGLVAPGAALTSVHGGFFPSRLSTGVSKGIWQVGDAAGQCFPFSCEGIRTSLLFGELAGELIAGLLEHRLTKEEAVKRYCQTIATISWGYFLLNLTQHFYLASPTWLSMKAWQLVGSLPILDYLHFRYQNQTEKVEQDLAKLEKKGFTQNQVLHTERGEVIGKSPGSS